MGCTSEPPYFPLRKKYTDDFRLYNCRIDTDIVLQLDSFTQQEDWWLALVGYKERSCNKLIQVGHLAQICSRLIRICTLNFGLKIRQWLHILPCWPKL
jgi:hypothetical protein